MGGGMDSFGSFVSYTSRYYTFAWTEDENSDFDFSRSLFEDFCAALRSSSDLGINSCTNYTRANIPTWKWQPRRKFAIYRLIID